MFAAGSLWELVGARANETPDRLMFVDQDDRTTTFGELRDAAERVAAGLHARGIRRGDVVAWQLPSRIDTVVLSMALCRLGAVQVPILHLYRQREVGYVLAHTGAGDVVVLREFQGFDHAAMAHEVAPDVRVHDVLDGLPDGAPSTLPAYEGPAPDEVRWIY